MASNIFFSNLHMPCGLLADFPICVSFVSPICLLVEVVSAFLKSVFLCHSCVVGIHFCLNFVVFHGGQAKMV